MIRDTEVFKIGYIAKQRGLRGEVEMSFTDDCFDAGSADYLVLDMDGILVPFFWEEYRFKNDDTLIIKFEDIDDEKKARTLVGHAVYYPKAHYVDTVEDGEGSTLSSYKALTGFKVYNQDNEEIGEILHVDDSSVNTLLTIADGEGDEMLFPFHNDFLLNYDLKERTLQLFIPEELKNLNK